MQFVVALFIGILVLGGITVGFLLNQLLEIKTAVKQIRSAIPGLVRAQNSELTAIGEIHSLVSKGSLMKGSEARTKVMSQIVSQMKKIEEEK